MFERFANAQVKVKLSLRLLVWVLKSESIKKSGIAALAFESIAVFGAQLDG